MVHRGYIVAYFLGMLHITWAYTVDSCHCG